jgi:hypothetical protein
MRASNKFTAIQVDKILNYPNGAPGFYFVRFRYADNIEQILQEETNVRRRLEEGAIFTRGNLPMCT